MRTSMVITLFLVLSPIASGSDADPQVEFTAPTPLLASDGSLAGWGWARRALMTYNREAIAPDKIGRVKEWEHYTVMSPEFTTGITIAQLGSLAFGSVEVIDYKEKTQTSSLFFVPPVKGQSIFPSHPFGSTDFHGKRDFITFRFENDRRLISFEIQKTAASPSFKGDIELINKRSDDSIALARPFHEPGQFFYENKIFGMPAIGTVSVDSKTYTLPSGKSFAIFDWGRGIWPRTSQWFWGQGAGRIDGHLVAINLGDGYGDDTRGTANAILIDGKLHKLHNVKCEYDPNDQMKAWKYTSDDGTLSLIFTPTYHQAAKQEILLAATELHKIHGYYSGELIVDGKTIKVDKLLGFGEHMSQRW